MRQLMYFLMVGLAFIVLQVSTVEAEEDCASLPTPDEVAACWDAAGPGCDTGHHDGEPHDPPMCAGPLDTMIPCPPPGGDGDSCAAEETPALVAACRANQTAAGN